MPNNILITKILKVNVTAMLVINIKLTTSKTLVASVTAMTAMTDVSHIDWMRGRSCIASRGHQGLLLIV